MNMLRNNTSSKQSRQQNTEQVRNTGWYSDQFKVRMSADASAAVTASDDGTLRLWDLNTLLCVRKPAAHLYLPLQQKSVNLQAQLTIFLLVALTIATCSAIKQQVGLLGT
eukprot:3399751-Amphidinium_carterae.1